MCRLYVLEFTYGDPRSVGPTKLIECAPAMSGGRIEKAVVTKALQEFIAQHSQKRRLKLRSTQSTSTKS